MLSFTHGECYSDIGWDNKLFCQTNQHFTLTNEHKSMSFVRMMFSEPCNSGGTASYLYVTLANEHKSMFFVRMMFSEPYSSGGTAVQMFSEPCNFAG